MNNDLLNQYIPYYQEAEEAVLGAILVNPLVFIEIASFLEPPHFFILRHQYIFEAMSRIHERREPLDYLTVNAELKAMDKLDDIGGPAYLTQLVNATPVSNHAEMYGRLVERAHIRRSLLNAGDRIKLLALDEEISATQAITEAEKEILGISTNQRDIKDLPFRDHISNHFDKLERLMKNPGELLGIPTGYKELDGILQGLQKSDLIILAARPGMGKTAMLVNIALHAARMNQRIGFITLEMGTDQIIQRMVSTETRINLQNLRGGNIGSGTGGLY